jgi:hypothetical protein
MIKQSQITVIKYAAFDLIFIGLLVLTIFAASAENIDTTWQTDIQRTHKQLTRAYIENARMCEVCKSKVQKYKEHMRNDEYARRTLETYETRLKKYCDPIAAGVN